MYNRVLFCFVSLCSLLIAKPLVYRDIQQTMQEMLEYHIEYKELSPLLVKRSFKIYLEQFDPEKMYLLKSEVLPYQELGRLQVRGVIDDFDRGSFGAYESCALMLSKAAIRARSLRGEVSAEIAAGKSVSMSKTTAHVDYASSERELKARIAARIYAALRLDERQLSKEKLQKGLELVDRKLARREKSYLLSQGQGVEHKVALHTLKALARSLDAHTSYYSPDEAYEIRTSLKKQLEGIGVVLRENLSGVYIADLIENGPAYQSGGVAVGDVIIEVNGRAVDRMEFDEILEELKGESGTSVELVLMRDGAPQKVKLTRRKIAMQGELVSYSFEPFADGIIGKIELPAFYDNGSDITAERHLRKALIGLKNEGNLRGIVIDMRENAGGFLTQAVKVAGMFITRGVVVISKYSEGEVQYLRNLDGRSFFDGPIVLLTSKASASAAEVVAGALQDYGVALVVGDQRTYGKGSMQYQTITDPRAEMFFKVTVGRYYTVSGKSTQIVGVPADVHVPTIYSPFNIGERYLEYPISGDQLASAFVDPLTGLDPKTKELLQQKYVPYLQKQEMRWKKMVPILVQNSRMRIKKDSNYQCFLNVINGKDTKCTRKNNFGSTDLQMKEAVNIVRDMVGTAIPAKNTRCSF